MIEQAWIDEAVEKHTFSLASVLMESSIKASIKMPITPMQREQMWRAKVSQVHFTPVGQLAPGSPPTCREIRLLGVKDQKDLTVHFIEPQAPMPKCPGIHFGRSGFVSLGWEQLSLRWHCLGRREFWSPKEVDRGWHCTNRKSFEMCKALYFQGAQRTFSMCTVKKKMLFKQNWLQLCLLCQPVT